MKRKLLLGVPLTLTITGPVFAPAGIVVTMELVVHEVTVAVTPLKVTVPVPCEAPNNAPSMVTVLPTAAGSGKMAVMVGSVTATEVTIRGVDTVTVLYPELCGVNVT